MKNKKLSCLISLILSLTILLTSLPLVVFASENNSADSLNTDTSLLTTEKAIVEVAEERTETTKTFRLADGSYYLAQYDNPIHRVDEEGEWQDIDNHLADDGSDYASSDARVKFTKKTTGDSVLFTLHDGNRKITMSLDGANKKVYGEITNTQTEHGADATELQKMTTLDKLSATILYPEILDGVDLEYVVVSNNIKENIIVKEKKDSYSYTFTMKLNNLTASQNADGEIVLSDRHTGSVAYIIPAGYMQDASGVSSNAVVYTLIDQGNGSYSLTVTPDAEWMNAANRAFPVTVDPPIYTENDALVYDVSVHSSGTENTQALSVSSEYTAYWKYVNLSNIQVPSSAYITKVSFIGDVYSQYEASMYVGVHPVTADWNESTSYENMSFNEDYYYDIQLITLSGEGDRDRCEWVITPLFNEWRNGNNYGLALSCLAGEGLLSISSSTTAIGEYRPRLCIEYRDMKGIEDYWTYSSQSAGFAGTGSINHATGNLTFAIPTLTTTDALMPFTPTLVYNTALANKPYTSANAQIPNASACTPYGFKWNMQETLLEKDYTDANGTERSMFVWADGDGTEHYFLPTAVAGTYKDEDGLQLTLTTSGTTYIIADPEGNCRYFYYNSTTSVWYLNNLLDTHGNRLTFIYDASGRPIAISMQPKNYASVTLEYRLRYLWQSHGGMESRIGGGGYLPICRNRNGTTSKNGRKLSALYASCALERFERGFQFRCSVCFL